MICSCIQHQCRHLGRRRMLGGLAAAPLMASAVPKLAFAADPGPNLAQAAGRNRLLIKGGHVVTIDRTLGDIAGGDVLVEGTNIVAVGRNLVATDAEVIDASNMVVMPGFIDSHRHTWQTALRSYVAQANYFQVVLTQLGPHYRPEDVYIGNLLGAVFLGFADRTSFHSDLPGFGLWRRRLEAALNGLRWTRVRTGQT